MKRFLALVVIFAASFVVAAATPAAAAPRSLTVTPHHVNCGEQLIDAGSKFCGNIVVTNKASSTVHINFVGFESGSSPAFILSTDTCTGQSLAPGGTCFLGVSFDPVATGHASGSVEVIDGTFDTITRFGVGGRGIATL
jgi:hypothetical protein